MIFDLHVHTTFSDGDKTPREVVEMAKEAGLDGIAVTDHDECRGYGEISKSDMEGIRVFAGIEIAAELEAKIHVLGLDIDWQNDVLVSYAQDASEKRQKRAARMLEMINDAGMELAMEEIEQECGGDVLGRPHFAAALVKKGYASSHKEAFVRYLSSHAPFYVPLDRVSAGRAVEMITGAGGKPVLAHPGLVNENVLETLIPQLADLGFWGIEAYHPVHTNGQCVAYAHKARQHGLYVTAGSDYHGSVKKDIRIGQETRGGAYLEKSLQKLLST